MGRQEEAVGSAQSSADGMTGPVRAQRSRLAKETRDIFIRWHSGGAQPHPLRCPIARAHRCRATSERGQTWSTSSLPRRLRNLGGNL